MNFHKVFETPDDGHYFFGYYDKSPLNKSNEKLLACKSLFIDRLPTKNDTLEIGYFNWKKSNEFISIVTTKAWNWQQGCMLQWLGSEYDKKIIYNDRRENQYVTIILDIETKQEEILPMAYYTASNNGDFVLCIDNERHEWYRESYSYKGVENDDKYKPYIGDDGIWYIDIRTKEKKQIITLEQIVSINNLSNMENAIHYLEHLMLSPNNNRFAFLHRWRTQDGGIYSRLYSSNTDGSDIYLLNDSGRMSHFCWQDNEYILGWGGVSNPINRMRKYKTVVKFFIKPLLPLYHKIIGNNSPIRSIITGDCYLIFEDKKNNIQKVAPELKEDGHPSFCNHKNIFVGRFNSNIRINSKH
jgi:hypothetical protein